MSANISNLKEPSITPPLSHYWKLSRKYAASGRIGPATPEGTIVINDLPADTKAFFMNQVVDVIDLALHGNNVQELWFFAAHDPTQIATPEINFARHIVDCLLSTGCIVPQHRAFWARAIITYLEQAAEVDPAIDGDDQAIYHDQLLRFAETLSPETVWAGWQTELSGDPKLPRMDTPIGWYTTDLFLLYRASRQSAEDKDYNGDEYLKHTPTVIIHGTRAIVADSWALYQLTGTALERMHHNKYKDLDDADVHDFGLIDFGFLGLTDVDEDND